VFDLEWQDRAACTGGNIDHFYPEHGSTESAARALAVCSRCPVVDDCRAYADSFETPSSTWGVWGHETRRARKARRKAGRRFREACPYPGTVRGLERHAETGAAPCAECKAFADRRAIYLERLAAIDDALRAGHRDDWIHRHLDVSKRTARRRRIQLGLAEPRRSPTHTACRVEESCA
jgi:WhiB family redox-sensing transcriptional regulator